MNRRMNPVSQCAGRCSCSSSARATSARICRASCTSVAVASSSVSLEQMFGRSLLDRWLRWRRVVPCSTRLCDVGGWDDQDRTVGVLHHRVRDAAEQQRLDSTPPAGADRDGIGMNLVGDREDCRGNARAHWLDTWLGSDPDVPESLGTVLCGDSRFPLDRGVDLLDVAQQGRVSEPEAAVREHLDIGLPNGENRDRHPRKQRRRALRGGASVGRPVEAEEYHGAPFVGRRMEVRVTRVTVAQTVLAEPSRWPSQSAP